MSLNDNALARLRQMGLHGTINDMENAYWSSNAVGVKTLTNAELSTEVGVMGIIYEVTDLPGRPQYRWDGTAFVTNPTVDEVGTYALLRAYTGPLTARYVRGVSSLFDGGAGIFRVDAGDTTSADNGGTILVDASGRRWKREFSGSVNIKWFGARGDGTTDDTVAVQAAVNAASGGCIVVSGTYLISASIDILSNTEIVLSKGAEIRSGVTNISLLRAIGKTAVRISGGKLKYTAAGSTGLNGGVEFNTCTHCSVEGVEFEGMQFAGVMLNESSYCRVVGNKFSATLGTHADSCDVCVYGNSNDNIVKDNACRGTGSHGVLVQGPGVTIPLRNKVVNNWVTQKLAFGIIVYQITAANSYTEVTGNVISDILGSALAGASGSGIYIQTSGGCIVANNTVRNCCTLTTSTSNLPAGISVASGSSTIAPTIVSGNQVNQPKFYGIAASGQSVAIISNYVTFSDGTDGFGIQVLNCRDSTVKANLVEMDVSIARQGVVVFASSGASSGIVVDGNTIRGGNSYLLDCVATGGTLAGVTVSSNTLISTGASSIAIALRSASQVSVVGNYAQTVNSGISVEACTDVRGSSNVSHAGQAFLSGGVCTRVFFDQTNDFEIHVSNARMQNTVAGSNVEHRFNAAPVSGNWQVGDRIEQTVPVVGQPKGWRCTVAGAPGTWVSEGNL